VGNVDLISFPNDYKKTIQFNLPFDFNGYLDGSGGDGGDAEMFLVDHISGEIKVIRDVHYDDVNVDDVNVDNLPNDNIFMYVK
jgi:hypothetical protein